MKKVYLLGVISMLALSLLVAGCGNSSKAGAPTSGNQSQSNMNNSNMPGMNHNGMNNGGGSNGNINMNQN